MKLLSGVGLLMLAASLALGQASTPATSLDASGIANELNKLQDALSEQQKRMAEQQAQITRQKEEIERLRQQVAGKQDAAKQDASASEAAPRIVDAALHSSAVPASAAVQQESPETNRHPLSFRIGGVDFTPGGFVDFENVFRTTNSGSVVTTNFGTIPFSNSPQGHLSEYRITGQFSRLSLKVAGKFGANDVTGYAEMDFNGNDAGNLFVTGNSHTDRLRLYYLDLKRGKWEFLGGQTWSWLTPNRNGVSPTPSDLAITYDEDGNAQVGFTYTRAAEFRAVYHPNDHWAGGIAIENPEQFTGSGAGEVTFPNAFNAQLGPQFDPTNAGNSTPNAAPDVIPKIAYDTDLAGRHFHAEAVGLMTTVKTTTLAGTPGATFQSNAKVGGGLGGAFNFELAKGFRFLADGFYGSGGGRYIIGLGPNAVVRPDGTPSMVHSGTGLAGFELQAGSKTQFGAYYGAAYFQRNFFLDTSAGAKANTFIGFGGPNSPNSNNKSIHEPTFDWTQTFWKSPQYGSVVFITQTSYLSRSPWFVAAGAPKNAHLVMVYASMRYVLP